MRVVERSLNINEKVQAMRKLLLLIVITIYLVTFLFACNNNSNSDSYRFYYYPDKNVYYDVSNQRFLYSLDGTKTWKSYVGAGTAEVPALGERIEVTSPDSLVYNDNEEHRRLYSGRLIDLGLLTAATAASAPEVSERKIAVKRKPVAKARGNDKPKKGIGKFLDKLFGKRK